MDVSEAGKGVVGKLFMNTLIPSQCALTEVALSSAVVSEIAPGTVVKVSLHPLTS